MKVRYRFKGEKATYGLDDVDWVEIIQETEKEAKPT